MADGFATLQADVLAALAGWDSPDPDQRASRDRYRAFLTERGAAGVARQGGPEHITASCVVLSEDLLSTVLCFHRKGRFWVQPGGHLEEGDPDLVGAALREAAEETGLDGLTAVPGVLDLDRHDLDGGFGACRAHWDVAVLAVVPGAARPRVSAESEEVGWFPLDALPVPLADRVAVRARRLRDQPPRPSGNMSGQASTHRWADELVQP